MPKQPSARQAQYIKVDSVPDGLTWKPGMGRGDAKNTTLMSLGNLYKLVRSRDTGAVTYYKHKSVDTDAKSPPEKIDAEPKKKSVRFRQGTRAWFVDTGGRWFMVEIVRRADSPARIAIKSVTGFDADRTSPWSYGEELEFPAKHNNPLFMRLRKLSDRYQ